MSQLKNYDPASPIQIVNGLVTTERSGMGKWGTQSQQGFFQFCQWLMQATRGNSTAVEIGAYAGEATMMLSLCCTKVIAIDPWVNGYDDDDKSSHAFPMEKVKESFQTRTKVATNITHYQTTSEKAVKKFEDRSIDVVYFDAIHKLGPTRDGLKLWLPKIKKDGYICGHDFCGYWGEVVDAVLEAVGVPDVVFKDGSWAKKAMFASSRE